MAKVNLNNFIGQKFGKLTLLSNGGYDLNHQIIANTICDCGKSYTILWRRLKKRHCEGCDSCTSGKNHREWKGIGDLSGSLFTQFKYGAKQRNLEFKITIEYIWELFLKQNRKCALTGWDLYFNKTNLDKDRTASLDRIDSSIGYLETNIQWVHTDINNLKCNLDQNHFIDICKAIAMTKS